MITNKTFKQNPCFDDCKISFVLPVTTILAYSLVSYNKDLFYRVLCHRVFSTGFLATMSSSKSDIVTQFVCLFVGLPSAHNQRNFFKLIRICRAIWSSGVGVLWYLIGVYRVFLACCKDV